MSSFLNAIAQDSENVLMTRSLSKYPFKNLTHQQGGEAKMYHFNCDVTYVRPESLRKLKKYVKYVPLADVSPRACTRSYFTIACVCEVRGDAIYVSDLHACKKVVHAYNHPPVAPFDIIAIANADVSGRMETKEACQIVRIGKNNSVVRCNHYGDGGDCSGVVDSRKSPTCDFHCSDMFRRAGENRMLLKQNTKIMATGTPESSPDRATILDRPPLRDLPATVVNEYIDSHSYGRGAKFARALEQKSGPVVGTGFSQGDVILL